MSRVSRDQQEMFCKCVKLYTVFLYVGSMINIGPFLAHFQIFLFSYVSPHPKGAVSGLGGCDGILSTFSNGR